MLVHRRVLHQQLHDGGHGEQVAHAVALDQRPHHRRVHLLAFQQHGGRAPGHVQQGVDAGAVRQWRHGDGAVGLIGAGNQVGQVVGHHEGHLAVREDAGLGPARGARGVEEPQRVVVGDHFVRRGARGGLLQVLRHQVVVRQLTLARPVDGNDVSQRGRGGAGRVHVGGEHVFRDHGHRPAGRGEIGHLGRRQAKVRRHPHAAQAKRHPATLEHRALVARVHEDAVTLLQAQGPQRRRHGRHALLDLAPSPARLALDQPGALREELGRVGEQAGEVAGLGGMHGMLMCDGAVRYHGGAEGIFARSTLHETARRR